MLAKQHLGEDTMSFKFLSLAAVSAVVFALPAWGHHSGVMYEPMKTLTVDATVKEFSWVNPHSWLYIIVTNESGQSNEWALETSSTGSLLRRGWTAQTLNPGDKISATFRPMKDGSPGGELESVTLENGQTLS